MPVRRALFQNGRSAKRSRTSINRTVSRAIAARTETKFVGLTGTFLNLPTTGTNLEINALSTGGDNGERIGNRIRNLRLTGCLHAQGTGTIRIIIYCPKRPQASLSTGIRFGALDNSDMWVLHDKCYNPGVIQDNAPNDSFCININKKLNFHTHWGSNSNNDFQRNPIKVYLVSSNQGGIQGKLEGHFKTFYKDS